MISSASNSNGSRMRLSTSCAAGRKMHSTPPARHPPARQQQASSAPLVYVIMGVSGCGKSSVGLALARQLSCSFYDADSYHPEANISKMRAGIALTDEDRWPWLNRLRDILAQHVAEGCPAVLACSALKPAYRQLLRSVADSAPQQDQQLPQPQQQQHQQHEEQHQQQHQQQHQHYKQAASQALQAPQPSKAPDPGTAPGIPQQSQSGGYSCPQGPDCIAFILLNPPRAVLQARLEARAAAGGHFMPASLLDSQLQQLDVQDPTELYMCFGCPQGTGLQREAIASCAHLDDGHLASTSGDTCTQEVRAAASEASKTAAGKTVYHETGSGFPDTEQIVAAVVARAGLV